MGRRASLKFSFTVKYHVIYNKRSSYGVTVKFIISMWNWPLASAINCGWETSQQMDFKLLYFDIETEFMYTHTSEVKAHKNPHLASVAQLVKLRNI